MGEIKSTLDLVMEKTKHLTLSPEEKEQQKLDEARKKIKGLIQKYLDGVLDIERFAKELAGMQETYGSMINDLLRDELLGSLHLGRDNKLRLTLLSEICGIDTTGLMPIFDGHHNEIQSATQDRVKTLKELLAQKRSISGSAVVPNVEMDKVWQTEVVAIHAKFDQRLNLEKAKYK
jgi:hypothetical protein